MRVQTSKGTEMKKLLSTLCAAALTLGTAITAAPAVAAPLMPAPVAEKAVDVENIQYRRHRGYYRDGGRHYYNGHRGYRHYRPGYRRYNDYWFPGGAFVAGALIGGALAAPGPYYYDQPIRRVYREPVRRVYRGGDAHVQWCYNRYRSYRAYDNTFQPYNGPRQQCYSPY
jgi:hypothetical protein